jgi:glutaredoxin
MPVLTLYQRPGCHLCADMRDELRSFQAELGFTLELVDIDREPGLRARYDRLVPVLAMGDREICHYFLDPAALRTTLGAAPAAG